MIDWMCLLSTQNVGNCLVHLRLVFILSGRVSGDVTNSNSAVVRHVEHIRAIVVRQLHHRTVLTHHHGVSRHYEGDFRQIGDDVTNRASAGM